MSADTSAFDPYKTPDMPAASTSSITKSGRPGMLTAICVICIVIGALGLFNGLFGTLGTVFGSQLQTMFTPRPGAGMPPEMQKIQQQFQDETLAVQKKFFTAILASSIFRMFIAGALLFGGITCLTFKEQGRQVLLLACFMAIAFEIAHAVLQSLVNMEMMTALNAFMEGLMQTLPQQGNGPPAGALRTFMQVGVMAGMVIAYVIAVVKIAFYGWACLYLQRQTTRALFAPSGAAPAAVLS